MRGNSPTIWNIIDINFIVIILLYGREFSMFYLTKNYKPLTTDDPNVIIAPMIIHPALVLSMDIRLSWHALLSNPSAMLKMIFPRVWGIPNGVFLELNQYNISKKDGSRRKILWNISCWKVKLKEKALVFFLKLNFLLYRKIWRLMMWVINDDKEDNNGKFSTSFHRTANNDATNFLKYNPFWLYCKIKIYPCMKKINFAESFFKDYGICCLLSRK